MSDPERLRSSSPNDMERLLLRSGRAPAPTAARQRAILAATAALGTAGLAAGAAAATGLTAKTGSVLSLKWLAVVGLAGLGAITAAVVLDQGQQSTSAHQASEPARLLSDRAPVLASRPSPVGSPSSVAASASASPSAEPPVAIADHPPPVTPPSAVPAAPAPVIAPEPSASAGTSVHAELASLEQARSALAAGDPARALSLLDAYGASFPRASMAPEATVLRVEALVRAGDRPAATRVGEAFLASHPQSPYSARVRSLLGLPNP